jgi:hypothetical protein
MERAFGLEHQPLTELQTNLIAWSDPHFDKDGDGQVTGRLGAGLVETATFLLGFSGDVCDVPNFAARETQSAAGPQWDHRLFQRWVLPSRGLARTPEEKAGDREYTIGLMHDLFSRQEGGPPGGFGQ